MHSKDSDSINRAEGDKYLENVLFYHNKLTSIIACLGSGRTRDAPKAWTNIPPIITFKYAFHCSSHID